MLHQWHSILSHLWARGGSSGVCVYVYLLSEGAFFPACRPGIQPLLPQGGGEVPDAGVLAEGLAQCWFSLWR